ncbi:MAG: glutathione S-transferase N-terminal domain-containing protein [Thermoplasmatota archaeon]
MADPVLYQYEACFESARVRRRLREVGVSFRRHTMPAGDSSTIRFKFGKTSVPLLVDGPFVSANLQEILAHIDRAYGRR